MRIPQWQMAALVLLTLPAAGVGAPAPAPVMNQGPPGPTELADVLSRPVQFGGFQADPKMTLQEALDAIADRYDLAFTVNEAAFAREKVTDLLSKPVAEKALPKMVNFKLVDVLGAILARVPCPSGATYLIRRHQIEITTGAAVRKELGRSNDDRLLPLVTVSLDRQLLEVALPRLAERSGFAIVLDGRAAEQARAPVSALFINVPLDTAVALLADMAGLDSVLIDNVCYVTSPENANRLRAKQAHKHPPRHHGEAENPKEPGPALATTAKSDAPPPAKGAAKGPGSPAPGTRRP